MSLDQRLDPARPEVVPVRKRVIGSVSPLRREPAHYAPLDTEALFGEHVSVYETNEEGWCRVQLETDKYVGWMPANDLIDADGEKPTHYISVPRGFLFSSADIKSPPRMGLPL